jgi:PadR family transcriptional regulator AphA
MARMNTTKYTLLGMLAFRSATGYDIKKAMSQTTDHFWSESDGAIYPILKHLLKEELVTLSLENEQSGRPRKVYSITKAGRAELEEWLCKEPLHHQGRNELLLKVFFGEHVEPKVTVEHITKFRARFAEKLKEYEAIWQRSNIKNRETNKIYGLLTLKAGILSLQSKIEWCDEALKLLKGKKK